MERDKHQLKLLRFGGTDNNVGPAAPGADSPAAETAAVVDVIDNAVPASVDAVNEAVDEAAENVDAAAEIDAAVNDSAEAVADAMPDEAVADASPVATAARPVPGYVSRVLRPGKDADKFGFLPEWPEKYGRDLSAETLGMKKLQGFKEVDPEQHRRKVAARERKKRRNKMIYIAIQSVLAALMLFAVAKLGENYKTNVEGREHQQQIRELTGKTAAPVVYVTPERTAPAYPVATPKRIEYNEDSMHMTRDDVMRYKNINDDFKFWLYIPDTQIDYYVMQGKDNDEYLRAGIYKQYLHSGCLFLDYRCNAETMEGHTIIYGHTMNDLSMLGELRDYLEKDHYDTHRYFYTFSPDTVTMWRIFSVYITTIDEYYIETYFRTPADYLKFIEGLNTSSMYPNDITLSTTDDVLTLSTCYRLYHGADGRLVVHAVKVGSTPLL